MANVAMDCMTLYEIAPYIKNTLSLQSKNIYKTTCTQYQEFHDKVCMYPRAKKTLDVLQHHEDFFSIFVDFSNWFPKKDWAELFYAEKLGYHIEHISSTLLYTVKQALDNYPAPNLAILQIKSSTLSACFRHSLFGEEISLYDIISDQIQSNYTVFDKEHLINPMADFTEIYIIKENMVALLPNDIAEVCDDNFIRGVTLSPNGLVSNGVLLKTLCGHRGICNSFYDLRAVK